METNDIQRLNTLNLLYIKIIQKFILYIKSASIETMLQKVGMDPWPFHTSSYHFICPLSPIKVVGNMFNLGCTATLFLDLLISVERCTVNMGHNYTALQIKKAVTAFLVEN